MPLISANPQRCLACFALRQKITNSMLKRYVFNDIVKENDSLTLVPVICCAEKMSSAYYMYSNATQINFITEANTMGSYGKGGGVWSGSILFAI